MSTTSRRAVLAGASKSRQSAAANRKVSAVSGVQHSGLEIVKRRPSRGKPATITGYAKIDFQAWAAEPDGKLLPDDKVMRGICTNSRLAYAVMLRSREQLVQMHKSIELEALDQLMAALAETGESLKALAHMVETAYLRVLAASCAHLVEAGDDALVSKREARAGQ